MNPTLQSVAPNVWLLTFPLKMLGADLRRNVTIIRLASGQLVIHSTGPFTEEDVTSIQTLGTPGWLIDTLLRHDTFAKEGRAAFPGIPYLAPVGFAEELPFDTLPLLPAPTEWNAELLVLEIKGAPEFDEYVVLHIPSRTLIVTDLLVNFPDSGHLWSDLLLRLATVHGHHDPGMTRPFHKAVKDLPAFRTSVEEILTWDFDRIIVGHGDVIEEGGKEKLRATFRDAEILS